MNKLIQELKNSNEDFEFYPTSKEMIKPIYDRINELDLSLEFLDIGCGTCNFKKYIEELDEERYNKEFEIKKKEFFNEFPDKKNKVEFCGNYSGYTVKEKITFRKYYVIEKSKILLDRLDRKTIVLGTDFRTDLLIDKPIDNIFCNPPYSEYKEWTFKILNEGNCYNIYLVIPRRWREDKKISNLIEKRGIEVKSLGEFDFENAERKARAKVEIVEFSKNKYERYKFDELKEVETNAFDEWFNETFGYSTDKEEEKINRFENEKEVIRSKLIHKQNDKVQLLVQLYENEVNTLFENFKAITSLDLDVLKTIGVDKDSLKEAVKLKTINLKNVYWEVVFDELDEITKRLTSKTRRRMLDKFTILKKVDFTPSNIYSLIIWVIKNANTYYDDQLVEFFTDLSSNSNVIPYKSNQKLFKHDRWAYRREHLSPCLLDYRIILSSRHFGFSHSSWDNEIRDWNYHEKINDIKCVMKNLGFEIFRVEKATCYGVKFYAYDYNDTVLFEYKLFKNQNIHIKFNIEFTKALNVEIGRILGWLRTKEDINKEFTEEMSKGAEKYFKQNKYFSISNTELKLLN